MREGRAALFRRLAAPGFELLATRLHELVDL